MTWQIELSEHAHEDLGKLERQLAQRIYRFLFVRLANLENPRAIGEALHGSKLGDYWKYRVGDYRIVCQIEDRRLLILALRIGHRREIYR